MDKIIFDSGFSVIEEMTENPQDGAIVDTPVSAPASVPAFEVGELVFEPAKEDDELPEGVWVPNRAWRRAAKKNKNKNKNNSTIPLLDSMHELTKTNEFKQETYKNLMEVIARKRKELIERENNDNGTDYEGK